MISEHVEIQRAEKNIVGGEDQENLLKKDPPKEFLATTLRGNRQIKINISKKTRSMITCDTIVIEDDDEEIVEAITKQMPPEILELDDSDEAKTNWTARWLESSHVKKVVTTSKILTNARKKMKMKMKVKEVPEVETAPPLVEAPSLIGSVEEYHRLVKEGVITSSSKDTSLEKKGAVETTEASLNSTTVENGDENVDRANTPRENEKACRVDQPRGKPDALEKTADNREIVQSNFTVKVPSFDPLIPTNIQESQTAQPLLGVDSSVIASNPNCAALKDIVLSGNDKTNLIDMPKIPEVQGEKLSSEIQGSSPQPSTTETNSVEDSGNKFSEPANLDPISSSIRSFYALMNPNQVIAIDLYSKSLSDIPIPPAFSEKNVKECNTLVSNQPAKLPTSGLSCSLATKSNDVGITSKSFIGPSNLICDRIEENKNNTSETNNLSAASGLGPQMSPGNELEEGEIEESDNEILSAVKNPNNIWVINTSPKVQPSLTIPSNADIRDIRLDNRPLIQPSGSSFSPAFNKNSVNHIVPVTDLALNRYTHNAIAGNSTVCSLPSLVSSQIVGQPTGTVQCANVAASSNLVHPTHSGSTISNSTLSSVVPPSYTIPEGQATPFMVNSALQNPTFSGVHAASLPVNPIQAATAEISNQYPYGVSASSSAHPQMSVNVNSTLHMYDPYYSWVYRQGLSGSLNSSYGYGYGAPEQSQDAGTIYKQWGEYYKKLMEACQDSAARASVSNMFQPPNVVESKGYSWVFERPNQASAITDRPETSTNVPKDVEPAPSQIPTGEWNYRYGLKGLLNEHFVTPGATPASTDTPNTPQGVPQGGPRGRRRAGRGRRRRKKK
uniref:Uncharacterized protein n=1 Tax=Lygus hesperus TaxID=30085 RepID=A0A0A9WJT4_LYGHE